MKRPVLAGFAAALVSTLAFVSLSTTVAQTRPVSLTSVTPRVARGVARHTALRQVRDGRFDGGTRLVVLQRASSALAWETTVVGRRAGEASRLTVYVDAASGRVL